MDALYFMIGVSFLFLRLFCIIFSSPYFLSLSLTRVTFLRVQVTRGLGCGVPHARINMGDSAEQPLHQHRRQP
jgi:hypothetical protein